MGLFDFVKNAGASLLGGGGMDSAELEAHLRGEFGNRVSSLKAAVDGSTARLVGVCDTLSTKEKVILMAGNVKGIESVNDDYLRVKEVAEVLQVEGQPTVVPTAPVVEEVITEAEQVVSEFYTIKSGDSLSKIAKEFYGDPMKYTDIFEANKEVIKDVNKIYPGQQIRIPKLT